MDQTQGAGHLPTPSSVGSTGRTSVEVTVVNGTPYDFELLFSNGRNGHSLRIPRCHGCQKVGPLSLVKPSCSDAAPRRSLTLAPGQYTVVARSPSHPDVHEFTGRWSLMSGIVYRDCYYIARHL